MFDKTELETRILQLAVSENDKTTLTGNNLIINIKGTIPLMSISDTLINRRKVIDTTYNGTVNGTKTATSRKDSNNTIVDINYKENNVSVDRFIFLTSFTSAITNNYMRAYYDKKFSDIILIPELEYIDQNIKGQTYQVLGYRVGGGTKMNNTYSDAIMPVEDTFKLPTTKEDINNKHIVATMHGLASNGDNGVWETISNTNISTNDKKNQLAGLLSLGTPSDVFNTPSSVPTYVLTQVDDNRYEIKYVGITTPTNIYIPIMF